MFFWHNWTNEQMERVTPSLIELLITKYIKVGSVMCPAIGPIMGVLPENTVGKLGLSCAKLRASIDLSCFD